ncbi:lysophospholipid acyltransferase family protein [Thiosocius teredinicola]|uniref:lysophospholipid acyltransferase family protein n=1 Tax=Thiosocius teredinicola TaxID=1973002 RepID=UPI000990F90E
MRDRLLRGLIRLIARLPLTWVSSLGAAIGRLLHRLDTREARTARVNIALCFPELTAEEQRQYARKSVVESGRSMAEMIKIWADDRTDWYALVEDEGFAQAAQSRLAKGRGLIFALPHIGNWEMMAYPLARVTSTTALYRPPRAQFMDDIMRKGRARPGIKPVPTDRQGLKALHAALQRGEAIVILPDQVPKAEGASGVIAPFFGHPAMTMTLISRLARRHGSPVMFCYSVFDPTIGRYRVSFFDGDADIAADSAELAATALNRDVERCAREFPTAYQWTYRRFEIPGQRRSSPYKQHNR